MGKLTALKVKALTEPGSYIDGDGLMLVVGSSAGAVTKSTAIDSTYVKAQRAAFGAKGGARNRRSGARGAAGRPSLS